MGNMIKGIIVGMAAGAVLGIYFDPLTKSERKMMKRKVEKAMNTMRCF